MSVPEKLKFCCMPILPTVFGEEMSYLEVLCKMRDSLNTMIDNMQKQDDAIADINQKVDDMGTKGYLPTAGGTLTGPLYFIDQNSVVKNADGTFTVQSNNPVVLKGGQTVAVNATDGIELRSDGTVLVTGSDGVSILDKNSAGVAVYEGNTAIAGNIEVNGPTTFGNVDVDMLNARTKVAEPVEDANPATKKYVDDNKAPGGGSGVGFVNKVLDSSKSTQTCAASELMPSAALANLYADNAGWLWLTTQFTQGRYVLENQNINVLTNAAFVGKEGKTSVKGIDIADSASSTYEATTNVTLHGGVDVDVTAGSGTVDIEGPIVNVNGTNHVNIETGQGGDVVFTTHGVNMVNAGSVKVPTPTQDYEAATKKYVDQNAGGGLKLMPLTDDGTNIPYIPVEDMNRAAPTHIWLMARIDSDTLDYVEGTVTVYSGAVATNDAYASRNGSNSRTLAAFGWDANYGLLLQDASLVEETYFGGVYAIVN